MQAKYYGAYAQAIEGGAKDKNLALEAEKLIAETLSKNKLLAVDSVAKAKAEKELRETIYRQLGIPLTMAAGAPALAGGFSVVGSRPS